jgi:hypothetical protein
MPRDENGCIIVNSVVKLLTDSAVCGSERRRYWQHSYAPTGLAFDCTARLRFEDVDRPQATG